MVSGLNANDSGLRQGQIDFSPSFNTIIVGVCPPNAAILTKLAENAQLDRWKKSDSMNCGLGWMENSWKIFEQSVAPHDAFSTVNHK